MDDLEVVREFIIESGENLSRLDNELVELEKRPDDSRLLASVFRTFHTIKGTCGFLGFPRLEALTHEAESVLSRLRSGEQKVSPDLISLILEVIDATRAHLAVIEATGADGADHHSRLIVRLKEAGAARSGGDPPPESPPQGGAAADAAAESGPVLSDSAIRVDVTLLDKLMNLVGELVLARNQVLQHQMRNEDASLSATSQRLNLITTELQEGVMKTRMQPIGVVWNKLPRLVRDISCSLGKQIRLDMQGAATELDKTIIEAIKDPLTHLVRNCCDHGIECPAAREIRGKSPTGRILLRAWHEGGLVMIEIRDDGAGLDPEALKQKAIATGHLRPDQAERLSAHEISQLVFLPGLSTARAVTSVSGRGVGMDVVRCNIERIGGSVELNSRTGEGLCVRLKIPLTLAIIPGLVVSLADRCGTPRGGACPGMAFVIPQVNLVELVRLEGDAGQANMHRIRNSRVYRLRGQLLPVVDLREALGLPGADTPASVVNIVVVQAENRQFGLVVDGIQDTQEIVVKPLGKQLKGLDVYAGATIMGDGRVALILDVVGLGQRAAVLGDTGRQTGPESRTSAMLDRQRLLVFGAGRFARLAVPVSLVSRLEEFASSDIESAGGRDVVQYRGGILPLVRLATLLDPGSPAVGAPEQSLEVIVIHDGDRGTGVVVDRILDIVEDEVSVRESATCAGILGSAVVGGRLVDLLDLRFVLEHGRFGARSTGGGETVLLVEPSGFARGLLRSGLEMAGYRVVEAASAPAALAALEQHPDAILAASLDLAPEGRESLMAAGRPLLALAADPGQQAGWSAAREGLEECQCKFDWEAMARSLQKLSAAVAGGREVPASAGPGRS
ncbi:MAG: chemotaxis protein CheA [Bryobacteraceae bacterium]|nr:chemotaxis protein CheA [Bryobacteraceae bacterium]